MQCPGQDTRFWKPEDIFDIDCPKCGKNLEFFKVDVRRKCRCGHEIINPKIDFGCAQWCPYGEQCIGTLPEEMKEKQRKDQEDSLRGRISKRMKRYLGSDSKRINHALKVADYAEKILKIEGGNPLVVLGAAYLHDLGTNEFEKKDQGESTGHPETEGPAIAREILEKLSVGKEIVDEVCDLVEHHRSPREEETLHFHILCEADWLANMEEEGISEDREEVERWIGRVFKTKTGRRLAEELSLHTPPHSTSP